MRTASGRRRKALGVELLRQDRKGETEFVTISYWESVEAMSRFAGGDRARSVTSTRMVIFSSSFRTPSSCSRSSRATARPGGPAPPANASNLLMT